MLEDFLEILRFLGVLSRVYYRLESYMLVKHREPLLISFFRFYFVKHWPETSLNRAKRLVRVHIMDFDMLRIEA